MSAEKELRELRFRLDCDEYDDEDEFDQVMDELYPEVVFEVANRAAKEGAVSGMHLYGIMLAHKAARMKEQGQECASELEEARNWVVKAAENGCWGAMDDLATEQTGLLSVPIELQIAFFKLSGGGGDLDEHLDYLRKFCKQTISKEETEKGLSLYSEILSKMSENKIEKKMCNCIFP